MLLFISWLRKNWINRFSGLKHFNGTALIERSRPAFFWLSYFNNKSAPHLSLIDHPVPARLGLSEVWTDTDGEYRDRAETDLTGDQRPAPAPTEPASVLSLLLRSLMMITRPPEVLESTSSDLYIIIIIIIITWIYLMLWQSCSDSSTRPWHALLHTSIKNVPSHCQARFRSWRY